MKKFLFFAIIAALLCSANSANAKIRRVGYFGTPVSGTDYSTFQLANDAASTGDSIYLFPGSWTGTLTKKLLLFGYGYFIAGTNPNTNLQNIAGALALNVTLIAKASGGHFKVLVGLRLYPDLD